MGYKFERTRFIAAVQRGCDDGMWVVARVVWTAADNDGVVVGLWMPTVGGGIVAAAAAVVGGGCGQRVKRRWRRVDFPDCEDSRAPVIHKNFTSSASFLGIRYPNLID
ncbi:hypothetical protein Tco_0394310 [Tanacetum coccineum]